MLINVNILCFINIGIPCKHLFGSFTASAIRSQHRTFFNINKNSQQIIFYDLRCESLFRMYEFLWNTWLIFSSVTVQYLTVTRKNPFQSAVPIGFLPSILSFLTVSAVNAQTYWTVTSIQYMRPPHTLPLCFLPQKRQSPWNSCIGDKLLQGLCLLNMYHNISLFREIHTGNMNFFAVARQRASRPSIFLAGIQSARKPVSITSTTMWFCNDPASS